MNWPGPPDEIGKATKSTFYTSEQLASICEPVCVLSMSTEYGPTA